MSFTEDRLDRIERQLRVMIWMMSFNIILSLANLVAVYKLDGAVTRLAAQISELSLKKATP